MMTSNSLPGTILGQQLEDSGEGMHPVPGDRMQYGLDLTHYMAVIENPESMMSRLGQEVCMGMPQQVASHRIPVEVGEESDMEDLGSYTDDIPTS